MPRIASPSAKDRATFRNALDGAARGLFNRLVEAVKKQTHDLAWYHRFGRLVVDFRESPGGSSRAGGFKALSGALGPSSSLLHKACQFLKLYPDEKAMRTVTAIGVDWMRLTLTFAIPKRADRHAILLDAVKEHWTQDKLRIEVQARFPSRRRGVGGRHRKLVTQGFDPEGALREFHRRLGLPIVFHKEVLAKKKDKDWAQLPPAGDPELLMRVLELAKSLREDLKQAASLIAATNKVVRGIIIRADRSRRDRVSSGSK